MNSFTGISAAPMMMPRTSPKRSGLQGVAILFAILLAVLLGLLTLLMIGIETGPIALLTGFVLATLPVPIYVALVLWIDRYESEPLWTLATAFFWGALVAIFIAFILNTLSSLIIALLFGENAGEFFGSVISAPVVEESAKALVLFGLYFWKRDEFDGVVDGIVYAAMVGLGFAMMENVQYYGGAALKGGIAGSIGLFVLRGAMAPFSHPLFTSMTGIGLGLASQSKKGAIKFVGPTLGLALAISLHSMWNLSATINGLLFFAAYFFIMVPIFVAVLVSIYFALRREGRIVREHLQCDLQQGLLTPEEYERLCTIRGRIGASYHALTKGGFGPWRARMEFNRIASELAFHRNRIARGLVEGDVSTAEREATYTHLLGQLKGRMSQR